MRYNREFSPLNLMMIPFDEQTCIFNNELVMSDNFQRSDNTSGFDDFVATPYPFQDTVHHDDILPWGAYACQVKLDGILFAQK